MSHCVLQSWSLTWPFSRAILSCIFGQCQSILTDTLGCWTSCDCSLAVLQFISVHLYSVCHFILPYFCANQPIPTEQNTNREFGTGLIITRQYYGTTWKPCYRRVRYIVLSQLFISFDILVVVDMATKIKDNKLVNKFYESLPQKNFDPQI